MMHVGDFEDMKNCPRHKVNKKDSGLQILGEKEYQ